jgi:hypothetical protein
VWLFIARAGTDVGAENATGDHKIQNFESVARLASNPSVLSF